MNSISIKIKIASLLGIATLVGIVLYVKADRTSEDESMDSSYTVRSAATTNLNAVMKAHPRANEYTSSEYTSKMAPGATQASEYLALYESMKVEDYSYQDNTGGYKRRTAPSTIQGQVPDKGTNKIEGQRPAQSNSKAYENFGVRSAVVKNDTIVEQVEEEVELEIEEEEEVDPRLQIATDVKQRVVGVDSYSRALRNAETNDDAYQVSGTQPIGNKYGGYVVRSADRGKAGYATTDDGYVRKSAPQGVGTNSQSSNDYAQENKSADKSYEGYAVRSAGGKDVKVAQQSSSDETYGGYAVRSSGGKKVGAAAQASLATTDGYARKRAPQGADESVTSLAQYDNAKGNDKAYQASNTSQNGETYGGYAVKSASKNSPAQNTATTAVEDGYARKRAPQGLNTTPVKDYAGINGTKARSAETEYGGYAVKSAGGKDMQTAQATSNDETYGGYAVRSAGKKSTTATSKDLATTEGGYARRRAPVVSGQSSTNLAQYDNASQNDGAYKVASTTAEDETYGGYAVRSAGKKSNKSVASSVDGYNRKSAPQGNSSREYAQAQGGSEETYGGYAVRSAGRKNAQATASSNVAPKSSRPRGGVPASTGLKMYGSRGERLTAKTSQKDRSVIVMPKRGRSVAGIVVQDDPGRSIIVQSTAGVQSTYRYGEIDALVNL